jgi:hypothetical protein
VWAEPGDRGRAGRAARLTTGTTRAASASKTIGTSTRRSWTIEDRFIVVGDPIGSGETTAHLIHSEEAAHPRARLTGDPWAINGHLTVGSLAS